METPPSLPPPCVSRNSKKRVFPGGSSIDGEVLEISRPTNWSTSNSRALKQKEVICHEIIDVDVENDSTDVARTGGNIKFSGKGKEILCNVSLSHGSSANSAPLKGVPHSNKYYPSSADNPIIIDDFGSDIGYGDDDPMDMYCDDLLYENYAVLQSQFDSMDVPPGVEASIPWMPGPVEEKMVSTTNRTSGRAASMALRDQSTSFRSSTSVSATTTGNPLDTGEELHGALGESLKKFRLFKKFDTVEDHSDHYYSQQASKAKRPSKNWSKKIQEEWKILEKDLPDTILVRVFEARMDLLRAVILGADGTPYHDGLFFFDVFFPSNYPKVPPHVYYHSFGLRLNPNLYANGKVCLSLLNTWSGQGKEKWLPGVSTMLQVLVSIQGLILNAKPYFNEPGYEGMSGTAAGENASLQYNESTYILNLKTMVYSMRRPPKHFEDFVIGHFFQSAQDILVACKAYMDGAQVGSLVRGGVQDVDEGDKSCSQSFKTSLAGFIKTVVDTLKGIGAKDCDKFLYLGQTGPVSIANPQGTM